MQLSEITPLILTRDEEANLERTLAQLSWADDVVIVDSFSTDATVEIARRFPNVRVLRREMDTLAGQSNYGLQQAHTPWVLLLDADYFVPAAFVDELREIEPPSGTRAYAASFRYAIGGKPLRASLYPARIVLLHREHATVWQDGHAHRVTADGDVRMLSTKIVHDDRKPFARFIERQKRYMREEAEKLRHADPRALSIPGRLRKLIVVAPVAVVIHSLFVKGLILDGVSGLRYTWERFVAELILSREMMRRR
ncbi:MAG TPA: glycosyltransferase family 2 protein [Thermoanaerobaculia bacterium]|nr:glycosyltransferase family 2 protein [Thermoanaerobaculia bacterium]